MMRASQYAVPPIIAVLIVACLPALAQPRVIEIVADKDSRYKIVGQRGEPFIEMRAGEPIILKFTAVRAKTGNRDGSIHGFALLRASDRNKVPGWSLLLRPGTQEFAMTAPSEPGDYIALCTVICSDDHEGMQMRIKVVP